MPTNQENMLSLQEEFHFRELGRGQFGFTLPNGIEVILKNFALPHLYMATESVFYPMRKELSRFSAKLLEEGTTNKHNLKNYKEAYGNYLMCAFQYIQVCSENMDSNLIAHYFQNLPIGDDVVHSTKIVCMIDLAMDIGIKRLNEFVELYQKQDVDAILQNEDKYPFEIIKGSTIEEAIEKYEGRNEHEEIDLSKINTIGSA